MSQQAWLFGLSSVMWHFPFFGVIGVNDHPKKKLNVYRWLNSETAGKVSSSHSQFYWNRKGIIMKTI